MAAASVAVCGSQTGKVTDILRQHHIAASDRRLEHLIVSAASETGSGHGSRLDPDSIQAIR